MRRPIFIGALLAAAVLLPSAGHALLPAVRVGDADVPLTEADFVTRVEGDVTSMSLRAPIRTAEYEIGALSFSFDPDPFLSFGFSVTNFGSNPVAYTVSFGSPFSGGPYTLAEAEIEATVTDTLKDGAAISSSTAENRLDAALISSLLFDCSVPASQTFGVSNTCSDTSTDAILSAASGSMSVSAFFILTPFFDEAAISGSFTISATAVTEPGTLALLGTALLGLGLARRRIPTRA